ncbi:MULTISPECIES: methyl-accepting chemotaxis protein [Halobacterium]|uniref:methyl-accepting chemotaxis protein n=1 Tax=Halobacterium TaxID=2239 RepID=UPI00073E5450|nr:MULTISPECIES: methyl-accepting chemotaxis protein [Halobacterium]MCG1004041.1 methyl-accepting chemotaxis protein [Halobacterium noricense]
MSSDQPTPADESDAEAAAVTEDRSLANARGALDVVHAASTTVDDQLAAIDDRTSEQVADAEWVVDEVGSLSATIQEIAATATEVSEQSERAAAETADGRDAARDAIDTMEDVREVSEDVVAEVDALRDRIDRIADALAGIDRIADQTNMLALNASIEAARTDGDNDGFAVVADEIKELAAESQEQADDIEDALDAVRAATEETVAQLDEAADEIERGADQTADAMASLDAVAETVEETAAGISSVSTATDDQAQTTEAVAERCETLAERATAIDDDVAAIRDARSEQTAMLGEVEGVLTAADADRRRRLADAPTLDTGVPGLDDLLGGGLVVGGQAVLRYDAGADAVDGLLAQVVATAATSGTAVSLTPPPTLDRGTLANAFAAADDSLADALDDDRLFVLDPFGGWPDDRNVFDLRASSLAAANETTAARRDAPLLVVGNIAGEVEILGEADARAARYENDDGVFDARDTVLNVVSDIVPETLAAFYAGAADQVVAVARDADGLAVERRRTPTSDDGTIRRADAQSSPPFVRVRGD